MIKKINKSEQIQGNHHRRQNCDLFSGGFLSRGEPGLLTEC